MDYIDDLDHCLLQLTPSSRLTTRGALEGIHVWGGIGSGKSSAVAYSLAQAFLRSGMGGCVTVAKPTDVEMWKDYARRNGRESSVIVFDRSRGFNFLAHALVMHGVDGVGSVIELLIAVLDMADRATGTGGKESDAFWGQASAQLLQYAVPLLHAAWGTVSVVSLLSFVTTAATRAEQYVDPTFMASSFAAQTLRRATDSPAAPLPESDLKTLLEYWFRQFTAIPERTRGNVVISLTSRLDRLLHGRLRDCFTGKTDIVPEMVLSGAIVILDMPVLTWQADGLVAQMIFKHSLQKVIEARMSLPAQYRNRPVFILCDEAQYVVSKQDDAFLSTCRASRTAMVYLSQNLPSYMARVTPDQRDSIEGLVGKFGTQIFCNNACPKTNQYASSLIGRGIQWRSNQSRSEGSNRSTGMNEGSGTNIGESTGGGTSSSGFGNQSSWNSNSSGSSGSSENHGINVGRGTNESRTVGGSEAMDAIIEPNEFSRLKTGGPANDNKVTAIWVKAGASFVDGFTPNALRVTFRQ